MFDKRFLKTFGVVCFALVMLAGCRPEEQGRVLNHEPGTYPVQKPTSPLGEDELAQLRQRATMQGGVPAGGSLSGGGTTTGDDVRPPRVESEADRQLQERGKLQGGN
ncbi:MAG: hypothetical protein JJ900_10980 [Rhodospirillales bacterium]|nr:hypothetical protein [Rhodospirillales bacterium]MBO6787363.1 hypothetical protein [Rhodospirillales bacterium]